MEWTNAYEWLVTLVGREVAIAVLLALGFIFVRFVWRQALAVQCFLSSRSRALEAVKREYTKDGPREGQGLWLQPPSKPENYDDAFGTRVLVVANNKGGVAKTTLSANLGAYWARDWKKSVLLIDLDYPGHVIEHGIADGPGLDPQGTRLRRDTRDQRRLGAERLCAVREDGSW